MKKNPIEIVRVDLSELMPLGEQDRKIMEQRARMLAMSEDKVSLVPENENDYITLMIGSDQYYGIRYIDIENIEHIKIITPMPNVPDYVAGIHYWHGKIIPIIHFATYLHVGEKASVKEAYLVTVRYRESIIGLLFDDVVGINHYKDNEIQSQLAEITNVEQRYVIGIHQGKTCILNIKSIITDISKSLMDSRESIYEINK